MNTHGAIVMDTRSGDLRAKPGFTLAVAKVERVTTKKHRYRLRGDIVDGYFCKIDDVVEVGPFPTSEQATDHAKRYAGIMERAV